MAAALHVLLVDDHALFREGLARLLLEINPGVSVQHAGSCEEALVRLAASERPFGLILLDWMMPMQSGLEGLAALRYGWPEVPVVVLSGREDAASVIAAIDAGAMGYVTKSSAPGALGHALETVLAGGVCVPAMPSPLASVARAPEPQLTPRQWEVLRLLLQGLPNKRIEQALQLAAPTVKAHVGAVLKALGVTTRTQAVIAAGRLGLQWRDRDDS